MSRLREAYTTPSHLMIISDQHRSIANAVETAYPKAAHGTCYYHLQNKITQYGKTLIKLYHDAAYAYTTYDFDHVIDGIRQAYPEAYEKLMDVGPEKWARANSPVRRYSQLTSNIAESINSRLLTARRLPICAMIEAISHMVEQWCDQRRAKAMARDNALIIAAELKLSLSEDRSHRFTVVSVNRDKFKVHDGMYQWRVQMSRSACECREWQLDEILYSHACAAIRAAGLKLLDYVSDAYKTENWKIIYARTLYPVPLCVISGCHQMWPQWLCCHH